MTNKVGMISLGCPKNQVDGEVMLEKLNKSGFEIAQSIEDSDVMIINTCGFIEDAKREAIETILEVAEYKKAGIISAIVVTVSIAGIPAKIIKTNINWSRLPQYIFKQTN